MGSSKAGEYAYAYKMTTADQPEDVNEGEWENKGGIIGNGRGANR